MKDLNRVLLVLLLDATIGPVSSGRNLDYRATFSRTERSTVGMTPRDAIQRHLVWFSEGLFAPTRVPTGGFCRAKRAKFSEFCSKNPGNTRYPGFGGVLLVFCSSATPKRGVRTEKGVLEQLCSNSAWK